jgi:UDP-glucose 4-epimerase
MVSKFAFQVHNLRRYSTVEADLNDRGVMRAALDACKFTHVLHLAAQAGVRYAVKNPGAYVHSNVAGMVNIMVGLCTLNQVDP